MNLTATLTTYTKLTSKVKIFVSLASLVIVLDQVTKSMVLNRFVLGSTLTVIRDYFNITYVQNRGAAFGFLAQADPAFRVPFFIVTPFLALGTIFYLFKNLPEDDLRSASALSLIVGGAVGNLIDRLVLGYVVDFLDFHWTWAYHFPAFNVADSAICLGVGLLLIDWVNQEIRKKVG